MQFHVITIHPDLFESYFSGSILGRAQESGKIAVEFYNPRDSTNDRHSTVDDKPYGGGPGMVLMAEPILKTVEQILSTKSEIPNKSQIQNSKFKILFFTPNGQQLTTNIAQSYAALDNIIMICGHYEGIDERVVEVLEDTFGKESVEKVSVGPYVLTGGELPAMTVVDAVSRFIPGVLGNHESNEVARNASSEVYTRPEILEWEGKEYTVPEVLLSGNHAEIEKWRKGQKDK